MWEKDEYFKGVSVTKVAFIIGLILGFMVFFAGIARAEDNKTINNPTSGFPKILDDDKWSSQLVYDTLGACYQGTIKWIIMTNPSLLGQMPGPMAQRQMMEHCFCVLDKVRKNQPLKEYIRRVFDQMYIGDLFMKKALECIGEYKTLPSFFMKIPTPDNETKSDNNTIIKPDKPKDSQDEPPGQTPKESNDLPDTLFQG
jgi:hypothetical protein